MAKKWRKLAKEQIIKAKKKESMKMAAWQRGKYENGENNNGISVSAKK
jgi:hypothetical protein